MLCNWAGLAGGVDIRRSLESQRLNWKWSNLRSTIRLFVVQWSSKTVGTCRNYLELRSWNARVIAYCREGETCHEHADIWRLADIVAIERVNVMSGRRSRKSWPCMPVILNPQNQHCRPVSNYPGMLTKISWVRLKVHEVRVVYEQACRNWRSSNSGFWTLRIFRFGFRWQLSWRFSSRQYDHVTCMIYILITILYMSNRQNYIIPI